MSDVSTGYTETQACDRLSINDFDLTREFDKKFKLVKLSELPLQKT